MHKGGGIEVDNIFGLALIALGLIVAFNLLLTLALIKKTSILPNPTTPSNSPLPVGSEAPTFLAETTDGGAYSLSDFVGRKLILVFVSPTCNPCLMKMPELIRLRSSLLKKNISLVITSIASMEQTRQLIHQFEIDFPILIAPRGENSLVENYAVYATPTFCSISEDGKIEGGGELNSEWTTLVSALE